MFRLALRGLLVLAGLAVLAVGINVGLGGIRTLGLQVSPDYVTVADAAGFAVQDSHVRFLGGLFTAIGAILVAGAMLLPRAWSTICLLCALMPVAGLFRLSGGSAGILNPELYMSLAFEFVLFPFLAYAIWRAYGRQTSGIGHRQTREEPAP
jgi:hypothetical protein